MNRSRALAIDVNGGELGDERVLELGPQVQLRYRDFLSAIDRASEAGRFVRHKTRLLIAFLVALPGIAPQQAFAKTRTHSREIDCGDDVADQQGVSAFSSLLDGQPTDPQRPTLAMGLSSASGTTQLQTAIQFAPGKERGACDAVLSLLLPIVTWDDKLHLGKTAGVGWEQRWHADDGHTPTIATSLSAVIDYSQPKLGVALTGTVIVVKTVGRVVFYGNGFVEYSKPPGSDAIWTPGFILGVKAPARADDAFILDLVVEKGAPASLELGYQLAAPDKFNIGPGIAVTLENSPQVTIGLVIQREF